MYFHLGRFADARKVLAEVVRTTDGKAGYESIHEHAKRDFVRMYAEDGDVRKAYAVLARLDRGRALELLGLLGEHYVKQGKLEQAILIFRELLRRDPKSDRVCDWHVTIVRESIGMQKQDLVDAMWELAKTYGLLASGAAGLPRLPEATLRACGDETRAMIGEQAKVWHVEGLKTLNQDTLAAADQLYLLYLDRFADAEDAPEMQFNHAELLWRRAELERDPREQERRWEEAGAEYTKVAEMPQASPAMRKEAAYAAVLAGKEYFEDPDVSAGLPATEDAPRPQPIPAGSQRRLRAYDVYLDVVTDPKDDERCVIIFLKARTFWKYDHLEEAVPLLEWVLQNRPDHEAAEWSANMLIDALVRTQRYDRLETWLDALLDEPRYERLLKDNPQLEANVVRMAGRVAGRLYRGGKVSECARRVERLHQRAGRRAPEALFDGAMCLERDGRSDRALRYREELIEAYPDDPLARQARRLLGESYATLGRFEEAAGQLEEYARVLAGERDAPAVLATAALYRAALGEDDQARADARIFIERYKHRRTQEVAAADLALANILEDRLDDEAMVTRLQEYIDTWGDRGGVDRLITAHVKIGEIRWRQSCPVKSVDGACVVLTREEAREAGGGLCGHRARSKITVRDREAHRAREAQRHFRAARDLWKGGAAAATIEGEDQADRSTRQAEAIARVAEASFYLTEERYERFLSIELPGRHDALVAARDLYMPIVSRAVSGGPEVAAAPWAVAASARIGQMYRDLSDELSGGLIPTALRADPQSVRSFCDGPVDGDSNFGKAVEAYNFCLDLSTRLGLQSDWSRLCERELGELAPGRFPGAGEIHARPDRLPATMDPGEPILVPGEDKAASGQ